jgi:two-component system, sensor histidine kinase
MSVFSRLLPHSIYNHALPEFCILFFLLIFTAFLFWQSYGRSRVVALWLVTGIPIYIIITISLLSPILGMIERQTIEKLMVYAPSYASVFKYMDHENINQDTKPDDPIYLRCIELQKEWLSANPFIMDVYAMKKKSNGTVYFTVDSETDYNHDGIFDNGREVRTPIGEIYEKKIPELDKAFNGEAAFTDYEYTDKWGTWVSAFVPIPTSKGTYDGILGIDFQSDVYLSYILRSAIYGFTFIFVFFCFLLFIARARISSIAKAHQLQVALNNSKKAELAKTEFAANISHEIRTPLNGMLGAVYLLTDSKESVNFSPSQKELLNILESSGKVLSSLVNDVLDFLKWDSKAFRLESRPLNLRSLIEEVIQIFALDVKKKGIALNFECNQAETYIVRSDSTRIQQVLINFISNAVKFTKHGEVRVHLNKIANLDDPTRCQIELKISDTGIGIPQSAQDRLFKPYSQADESTTRKYGGTGLGLVISKAIIDLMNGEIRIDSIEGKGTTFTILVSLEIATEAEWIAEMEEDNVKGSS